MVDESKRVRLEGGGGGTLDARYQFAAAAVIVCQIAASKMKFHVRSQQQQSLET